MSEVTFDIEANGFLNDATYIHCISIIDNDSPPVCYYGNNISAALKHINSAEKLIGHNIIGYDLPLLKKLYGFTPRDSVAIRDTYIITQMLWPDIISKDLQSKKLPKKYWGSYGLRAFGYRLGMHKGSIEDFSRFTQEMIDYCNQDVLITNKLWHMCLVKGASATAVELEMEFAHLAHLIQTRGIGFDTDKARELYLTVSSEKDELLQSLGSLVPPRIEELRTPQYWLDPGTNVKYKKKGDASSAARKSLVRGPNKVREYPFNPMSRQQVATFLMSRGWTPSEETPTGKPKIDESVLIEIIGIPEAEEIARLYRLQKLLAMLHDGKEGWLRLVTDANRLHPRLRTVGTISGRTSCVRPNLQQVPSPRLTYGKECRELFTAEDGRLLCGVDAKSLEVRCFAHYLARYDSGEFADEVVVGDIHASNAKLMGCPRPVAKNTFFALLYGASPTKIATMLDYTVDEAKDLIDGLYARRPHMKLFMNAVRERARTCGFLSGLDGRKLLPRSPHSSVNLLIQAAGACVSKQAAINTHKTLAEHWSDYDLGLVGFIHDEIIIDVPEDVAEAVTNVSIIAFKKTTGQFSLRCPMDGDGRIGKTWYDIH